MISITLFNFLNNSILYKKVILLYKIVSFKPFDDVYVA